MPNAVKTVALAFVRQTAQPKSYPWALTYAAIELEAVSNSTARRRKLLPVVAGEREVLKTGEVVRQTGWDTPPFSVPADAAAIPALTSVAEVADDGQVVPPQTVKTCPASESVA